MKQIEAFNLQRFAEPVQGAKLLYLLRILKDKTKNTAKVLAFQTEGTTTISKDADSTATKDGTIRIPSPAEIEISLTALLAKGDTMIDDLKAAMLNDELIEIWEVDASQEGTGDTDGKYKSTYYALLAKGDTMIDDLKAAMLNDELIEIWEVDASQEGTGDTDGKYKSTYYQGYMTNLEKSANAEDFVELSMDFGINGSGVDGWATLTVEQQQAAQYVFTDTTKASA